MAPNLLQLGALLRDEDLVGPHLGADAHHALGLSQETAELAQDMPGHRTSSIFGGVSASGPTAVLKCVNGVCPQQSDTCC